MNQAGKHLDAIHAFLSEKSVKAATDTYNELIDAADILLTFPQAGKIEAALEESTQCYRSLVVCKHYKLIYRIDKETIKIMAVWDCRQNPNRLNKLI